MRSTFILATLAIGAFAAPVPGAEPWTRKTGDKTVQDPMESGRRFAAPEPFDRGTHTKTQSVNVEGDLEARAFTRPNHQDGDASAVFAEARGAIQNESNKRSVREHKRSVGERSLPTDDNLEARGSGRVRPVQNGAVCHPGWNSNRCGVDNKRSTEDDIETEVEAEDNLDQRSAEPEPFSRAGAGRRDAAPEPFGRAGAGRRDAAPEPFGRAGAGRRDAAPEPFGRAGAGRRDAKAEPAISHSNQKTGSCHPGHWGSHC